MSDVCKIYKIEKQSFASKLVEVTQVALFKFIIQTYTENYSN